MENGKARQEKIKATLHAAQNPVSATQFAKSFAVSRQTIVGDIALLRATGEKILATPTGYEYAQPTMPLQYTIVCVHTLAQTEEELQIIIDGGGTVMNVAVDHPIYGQLSGQLIIRNHQDIRQFMQHLERFKGHLLSELTNGVHSHLIAVENENQIEQIKVALQQKGILYDTLG